MVQNTKEILIWVGLVAAVSAGAAGLLGSGVISSAQTESLEIAEASFKKANNADGVLTIAIKNAGTSEIEDVDVTINGVELGIAAPTITDSSGTAVSITGACNTNAGCSLTFDGDDITAGQTTYFSATITNSADTVSIGNSFTISAVGDLTGTDDIVATGVVTATGF